jgi:hypothetical protein
MSLPARLDSLIDRWCARRALAPLRLLLPVYPLVNGLSDEWHDLRRALQNLRGLAPETLASDERRDVQAALLEVERVPRENGWPLAG